MRKLPVFRLKSGMIVARTVFTGGGQVLIKSGTELSSSMIRRLRMLGVAAIYVEDGLLPDVEVDDVVSEQTRSHARTLVREMLISDTGRQSKGLRLGKELADTVNSLLEDILSNPGAVLKLADIRNVDDYTFGHSVNVAVLSLLIGVEMTLTREELFHLGMGAILHDMGKILVPPQVLNKPGALSKEEFEIIKRHTEMGFEILTGKQDISNAAAHVALQHHERLNGEGYPRGLTDKEISRFAKIVAVSDVFDALTSDRVYRRANLPHEALEMLSGSGGLHYDFQVIKSFYQRVAAYPTGTFLGLNTGEIAAVVDTPKGQPLRPKVRVMFDSEGKFLQQPYEIELADKLTVVINRVVAEEEIQRLLQQTGNSDIKMI